MKGLNGKMCNGNERVVLIDQRWLMEMELKLVKLIKLLCDGGCYVDGNQYEFVLDMFRKISAVTDNDHLPQITQQHQDYQLYSSTLTQHHIITKEHPPQQLLTNYHHHHHHQIKVYMFFTTTMTQNNQHQTKNPTPSSPNMIQIMGEKRTILQIKRLQQLPSQNIKNKTNNDNSLQPIMMVGDENCQQQQLLQKQHHQHQSSSSNDSSSPNKMISSSYDSNCDSISNPVAFILRQKNNQNNKRNLQQNSNNNVFNNCVAFGNHGMEEIDCQPVFYYYGQFNNNGNGNDNDNCNSNKDGNEIQNTINYNNSLIHIDVDRKGHQQHGGQTKYNNTQTQNTTTTTTTSFKRDSSGMNLPLNNALTLKNTLNNTLNDTLTLKINKIPTDRQQQMIRLAIIEKEKITKKKIQKRKKETRKLLLQQEDDQQQQSQIVRNELNKRVQSVRNNNGIEFSFMNVNINTNNNNINQINQNSSSNLFITNNTQTLSPPSLLSPPTLLAPTTVSNNNIQTQHSIITRNVRLQSNKQLDKLITTYNNNSQQLRVDKQWNNQGDNNRREGINININIKQNDCCDDKFVGDISNKKRVKSNQLGDVQKSNMNMNIKQQQHYLQQQQQHGQQRHQLQQHHHQQQQQLQHHQIAPYYQEPITTPPPPPLLQQPQLSTNSHQQQSTPITLTLSHQQFHEHNYLNNQHHHYQQQQQQQSHIHPLNVYSNNKIDHMNRGQQNRLIDNFINSGMINCDELTVQEMMLMELLYYCPTYCVHTDYYVNINVNTNMNLNVNVNNQHYQQQRQQQYHQQQQLLHKQQQYQQKINTFNYDYNNNSLIRQLTKSFKQLLTYQTNTVDEFNQFVVQKMFTSEKQEKEVKNNNNNNLQHFQQQRQYQQQQQHIYLSTNQSTDNKPLTLHLLIQVMKQTLHQLTLQLIKQTNRLHSYSQQQQQHRQLSLYQHIQHICNNNDNNVEIMMSSLRQIIQGEFQSNVNRVIDLTTTTITKSGVNNSCDKEKSNTIQIAIKSQQQLTGRQLQLYKLIKDYVNSNNVNRNNNVISYSQQKHNQSKFQSILNQFVNVLQMDCSSADYSCCCDNNQNRNKQKYKQKQNSSTKSPIISQSQQQPSPILKKHQQQQQTTTNQYKLTNYIQNVQIKVRQLQQIVNSIMYDVYGNNNNKSDNYYQYKGMQMMDCLSGEVVTYYPHYDIGNNHYNEFLKSMQLNQCNNLNKPTSLYHHQSNTGSMLTQQLSQTSLLTQSVQRFMSQKCKHSTTNSLGMNSFGNNNNNFYQSKSIQQTIISNITQNSGDGNAMIDQQQAQSIKTTVTQTIKMLDHILADVQLMTIQLSIMY